MRNTEGRARTSRVGDDRGASLVEFALLLPILMLVLFGAITGGLTLSRHNAVQNAAREASRFGATAPIDDPDIATMLDGVAKEVEAAATGDLDDGTDGKSICVAYITAGSPGMATSLAVAEDGSETPGNSVCFADGRDEARIQVVAKRDSEIDTIFRAFTVNIEAQSVSRYERAP